MAEPTGGTGPQLEPFGNHCAGLTGGPSGLTRTLKGIPGGLVLVDQQQAGNLAIGIFNTARLGLGQGDTQPPGAGLIAQQQAQPQRPTQGEEVARVLLPGVQKAGQRVLDLP